MHQFILYASIPNNQEDQVLKILAGIAATRPVAYAEQRVIYAQSSTTRADPDLIAKRKPQQSNTQRYYQYICRTLDPISHEARSEWRLEVKEEPEAGNPHVISQPCQTIDHFNLNNYISSNAFDFVNNQIHSGHYIVHGNVVIRLCRVLLPQHQADQPLSSPPFKLDQSKVLDQSGSYLVEALVRIEDRKDSKIADAATKELLEMKKVLQGCIPLYAPDRLSLDNRIRAG